MRKPSENYSRSFSRQIIRIDYFALVLQSRAGLFQPFTGALGSDRSNDDIADRSLAVNEKRRGRAEDAIGPLHRAVQIQRDGKDELGFLRVLHDGGAGVFNGNAQYGVAVLAGFTRQLVDQRHFVPARIAPAGEEIHHQWFTAKARQSNRVAVQRFQVERDGGSADTRRRTLSAVLSMLCPADCWREDQYDGRAQ